MEGTWVTAHSHHMSWRVLTSEWSEDLGWQDLLGPDDGRFFSGRDLEILGTEGMGKPCSEWRPIGRVFRELCLKWRMISWFDHLRSVTEAIFGLTPIAGFVLFMGKSDEKMDDLGRCPMTWETEIHGWSGHGGNLQDLTDARLLYSDIKQWENPWDSDG